MAEARPDCTELSEAIAESAFIIADNMTAPTLAKVTTELQSEIDATNSGVQLTRQMVSDAILDFSFQNRRQSAERVISGAARVLQEARGDERLQQQIRKLERDLNEGNLGQTQNAIDRRIKNEVKLLRRQRGKLTAKQSAVTTLDAQIKKREDAPKRARPSKEIQRLRNKRDRLAQELRLKEAIDSLTNQLEGVEPFQISQPRTLRFNDPQLIALRAQKKLLRDQVESQIRNLKPLTTLETVGEIGNTSRTLLTIADLSATLRQGGKLGLANPSLIARNFGPSLRAFFSPQFAAEVDVRIRDLEQNPNAWMYTQGKLHISDPASAMSKQEEAFMRRNFLDNIPGLGSLVRGSERSFVTFLNLMRAQSFDRMAKGTRNGTPTLEEMRGIANAINILTGRGDLGRFNSAATVLNQFLFAPRYVASQFQTLAFNPIRKAPSGPVRRQVIGVYARMLANFGLLSALAAMAGFDIELDPRSSDFLKYRKDKTRVDMGTGLLQPIVLISKVASGQSKSAVTGKIANLRGPRTGPDRRTFGRSVPNELGRFLRSKFNPLVGMSVDLMAGQNVIGDEVTVKTVEGIKNLGINQVLPISVQEMIEILREEEDLDDAAIFMLLSILGAGVSTFDTKETRQQTR